MAVDPLQQFVDNLANPQLAPVPEPAEVSSPSGGYSIGETFQKGMQAGAEGFAADLSYLQALGNSLIGDEESLATNVATARRREEFASDAVAGLQQFDEFIDEPTFEGFVSQVSKGTGQLVPFAITSVLGAGFGAAAGVGAKVTAEGSKLAAKRIVKDSLEKTAKGIAAPDEKEIAQATWDLAKRARYGAYGGAGASEFAPLSGSNFSEAIESGEDPNDPMVAFRAAALGVPQAAIGVGGEVALLKLIGNRAKKMSGGDANTVMGRLAQDLGTGILRGGAIEAGTELAQEGLAVLNRAEMDDSFTAQDAQMRLGEAAFAAFFGGGAISGAGAVSAGGVREVVNAPSNVPDSVKQKARDLLEQGKQSITDIVTNTEAFAQGGTQYTNPEPQADLNAQIEAMFSPDNAKEVVWSEGPEPAFGASADGKTSRKEINGKPAYVAFIDGRGTVVSPYADVVQEVVNGRASEAVLAAALGYSSEKPGDADRVVQVLDAQGRIISEEATNEAGLSAALNAATPLMPKGGSLKTVSAEEAVLERAEKVRAESKPVVTDVIEDEVVQQAAEPAPDFEGIAVDPNYVVRGQRVADIMDFEMSTIREELRIKGDNRTPSENADYAAILGEVARRTGRDDAYSAIGPVVRDMNVDPETGAVSVADREAEVEAAQEREALGQRIAALAKADPKNKRLQTLNKQYQEADPQARQDIVNALQIELRASQQRPETNEGVFEDGAGVLDPDTDVDFETGVENDVADPVSGISEQSAQLTGELSYAELPLDQDGVIREYGEEAEVRQQFQETFEGVYRPNFTDGGFWQRMSPFMLKRLVALRKAGKEVEIEPPSRRAVRESDGRNTYGIKIFSTETDLFRHQPRTKKTVTDPVTKKKRKVTADEQLLEIDEFLEAEVKLATTSQYAKDSGFLIEAPLAEYDPDTRQPGLMSGKRQAINLVDLVNSGRRLLETRQQQEFTASSDADALLEMVNELVGRGYKIFAVAQGSKGKTREIDITITQPVTPSKAKESLGKQLRQEGSSILGELAAYQQRVGTWFLENSDPDPADATNRLLREDAPDKPIPPPYLQPILSTTAKVENGVKTPLRKVLTKNLSRTRNPEDVAQFEQRRKEELEARTGQQQAVGKPPISDRAERFPFLRTENQESMMDDFEQALEQQQLAEEGLVDRPDFADNPGGSVDNPNPDRVETDEDVPYAYYSVQRPSGKPARRYNAPISFPFGEPTVTANSPSNVVEVLKAAARKLQLKKPIGVVTLSQLEGLTGAQIAEKFGDRNVAKHFVKIMKQLKDNPNALGRSITYSNAHFILVDDVSTSNDVETTLVAAHELGHAFFQEELDGLVQKPVFKRMWQSFKNRDRSVKAYEGPHGFEEWFADNVAKWASAEYQNAKAKNLEESTFKKIAAKFKQFFNAVRTSLRKRFGGAVDVDVQSFIDMAIRANDSNYAATRQQGTAAEVASYPTFEKKVLVRSIQAEVEMTAGAKQLAEGLTKTVVGRVREAVRLAKPLRHVFFTANKNLRTINKRIADMFYIEGGTSSRGSRMGFLQEADVQNREFEVAFEKAVGPLDSPEVISAMEEAATETPTAELGEMAQKIRNFLQDIHTEYVEPMQSRYAANKKIGFQENYFPVVLNMQEVAGRADAFVELILSQPSQAGRNPFTARKRVEAAVARIIKYQDVVTNGDLAVDEDLDPNAGREQSRDLTAGIDRETLQQAGFLVPPVEAFKTYKKQLVKRVEWNRSTKTILGNSRLDPMLEELSPEDKTYAQEIINSYLGYGYEPMSKERRKWQSRLLAAQYTLLLPFAAIGSLPELAGPIIFSKEFNGFEMAFRQIKQGMSQVEARQLAEDIGLVQDGSVSNAWMSVTEREYMDESSRAWTDGFFKVTGLEWFTNFTRSFATGMAVQFLLRHATNEANNPRSQRYLDDLGVTAEQVLAWDKGGRDINSAEGRAVKFAIQKFVESSILRPNAAERPVWASDPRWALVWQLKSYFYAFYTKIIGGIRREAGTRIEEGEGGARIAAATGILALSAATLLPLAMAGMELREYAKTGTAFALSLGQSDKNYFRTDDMEWGAYLGEVLDKTGIYGPLSIVTMAMRTNEWHGSGAGLATLLGPSFEMVEAVVGRGEFDRIVPAAAIL